MVTTLWSQSCGHAVTIGSATPKASTSRPRGGASACGAHARGAMRPLIDYTIVRSVSDSTNTKKVAKPTKDTVLTNRLGCCARTDWASSCTEIATDILWPIDTNR